MNLVKPFKNILCKITLTKGQDYWPYPMNEYDEWWEGGSNPRHYTWNVSVELSKTQQHAYPNTTIKYQYTLNDVRVGDFFINSRSNSVYRVREVVSKTGTAMECIIEDVYRLQTFRNFNGEFSPNRGDAGMIISHENFSTFIDTDTLPTTFNRSVLLNVNPFLSQLKFLENPIFQCECSFDVGDVVSVDKGVGFTTPVGNLNRKVVGRVIGGTSIPHEYIVEPITDHVEIFQDVGDVGEVLYLEDDGKTLSTTMTNKPQYLKTTDAVPNVARSNPDTFEPKIKAGTEILLNGIEYTFDVETTLSEFATLINDADNGIAVGEEFPPFSITHDKSRLANGLIGVMDIPTVIKINDTDVTISTTDQGQADYSSDVAVGQDIAKDINAAKVPFITAQFRQDTNKLIITNSEGEDITIENVSGGTFASDTEKSAAGFNETNTSPKDQTLLVMRTPNGEEIDIRELKGSFTRDSGISGSDNGNRAMGIFYGGKVREGTNFVIADMDAMSTLSPYIGDGLHVEDSGNGEWVEMKYTASGWITIATEDSARTDADTLSIDVTHEDSGEVLIGTVSPNSRISNIVVIVNEEFDGEEMTINVGDSVNSNSLISDSFIDLLNKGTYTNTPSNVYDGETDLFVTIGNNTSTKGEAKIIISYM